METLSILIEDVLVDRAPITVVEDFLPIRENHSLRISKGKNVGDFKFKWLDLTNGNLTELKDNSFPEEINEWRCAYSVAEYGAIYLREFKVMNVVTNNTRDMLVSTEPRIIGQMFKDSIMFLLRLNVSTMFNKKQAFTATIKEGLNKVKGLSETELKFLRESNVPLFIYSDFGKTMDKNPPRYHKAYIKYLERAEEYLQNFISEDFGNDFVLDDNVYVYGLKAHKDLNDAKTVYVPKAKLIEKGYNNPTSYLTELYEKVYNTDVLSLARIF